MPEHGLMAILATILSAYFTAIGSVYLKRGSKVFSFNVKKFLNNENLVIGSSLHALASIIFFAALRFNEVSILYPFIATSYIWVAVMSKKYLYEEIDKFNWLGVTFITLGVVLIGIGGL